jgi:hypothetical protein
MPDFTYTGADERYYPSFSLDVKPGDVVTLDSDPGDGRFQPKGSAPVSTPSPAPVAPAPAPADVPEVGN